MPDEATVRKLTRRIGPETVNDMTRVRIESARERALSGARGADRLGDDRGRSSNVMRAVFPRQVS